MASGSDRSYTVWRMEARSWSPLCATPPPITISDGLKKFTTLASIWPTSRPASVSSSSATGSPNAAARATSSALTVPRSSSAAARRLLRPPTAAASPWIPSAYPPASASRQPTLPHRHTTDRSSTTWMCPTSPADPWAPRWSRPSEMIPAPIPVPILITTTLSWPWAMPDRHSPSARTLTSLSTQTGAPKPSANRSRIG